MSLDPDPPAEPMALQRTASPVGDMDPETFRDAAHRAVDLLADYLATVEARPVFPPVEPGSIGPLFPAVPPEHGEPLDAILEDVERLILPNLTHWQHPGFFAYFSTSASGPGVLGELLTAALGQNPMLWRTSPVGTELEGVVVGWLRQALGLPGSFDGLSPIPRRRRRSSRSPRPVRPGASTRLPADWPAGTSERRASTPPSRRTARSRRRA